METAYTIVTMVGICGGWYGTAKLVEHRGDTLFNALAPFASALITPIALLELCRWAG